MVLSKEQVKSHIAGVESRISDPLELKHHGYEFAKLLYQVKEYDSAVIYLANFISVNGRDPRAHKLMGHLCNATAENGKAIAHYKRSLELKRGQRDVIEALVSVYLKLEKPPVDSLKECLQHIEAIGQSHPLIVPLCEKIQSLEGGFSMEKVIKKALAVNTNDVNLHIRLVKLYCQSGKSQEAFYYCEDLYRAGQLTDSLQWQLFALTIAEDYYENLRAKGVRDGVETLEILVTLLEFTTTLFNLLACPSSDLDDSAALLLKFDKVLCASGQMLSVLPPSALPLFQMALKQLCAQLYFMAGRYLFLLAWQQRQSLLSSITVASIMGVMCLLSSMKAPPWDLEQYRTLDKRTHLRLRTWYNTACARTSITGRHLMLIEAAKGKLFFESLPKIAMEMGGKLHLIKILFGGTNRKFKAKFGSRDIKFSLQESFLSNDGTFLTLPVLPSAQELENYDRECIAQERQLCNLLWRCLAYKALNKQPFLFLWMGRMFNDLRLDTPSLDSTEPSTLCVLDIEAFLAHLLTEYSERLTSPQLFSVPTMTAVNLMTALVSCLPVCLSLKNPHQHYWTALLTFLLGKLSAQDAASVKKVVREFLSFVRGSSPLQLSLEHLTSLARHFKKRAELETDEDDRDVIMMLLKRSCHYWAIVEHILSPSSDSSQSELLSEARMTIANEALYRQDMSRALRLYSRVKTAPSAWNQSEVYLHLANMSGQADTREKVDSRLDNLQKAADALDLAITRLTPEHEIKNLRQKFLLQRDNIKDLLGETKKSPLACALDYEEESPSLPRRFSSTPANTKTPPLSQMTSPFTDQSRKHEQKLLEMASQLEKLQAEMDLIKSRTTRTNNQSQMSPQSFTMYPGMQSHSQTNLSYGPRLMSPAPNYDPHFRGQLSPQGLGQQWLPGQQPLFHEQISPRQTSPLNMFQLQPNRMAMFSQQQSPPPLAVPQPNNSFQGIATGIQTLTTPPRLFAPQSPINRSPQSVEALTTPPRFFAPRSPINRSPQSVETFTTPPRLFAPQNPINRPPQSVEALTTPPRFFAPRSPINRSPQSVETPRPFAPRSPINIPPLTLPQHLLSHSFVPAIGGPQLISPSTKPVSLGAASNGDTMPTTNEQVVSTTPKLVQNRSFLTPKFQPPVLAHPLPSVQATGLGNLLPSQQPLLVKNTALPFTVSATSPKNDDVTTSGHKSGIKRTASGFGVLGSQSFSFTAPVSFTFGQTTSSASQFPAFGTTTVDGTDKPVTTTKEPSSIFPKPYSFPMNNQPPPSIIPAGTSSEPTFTVPSFSMNPTTSSPSATLAKTSQSFSILGNSSLFSFANFSPTQSPVVTSVQTETIATSKAPILSSLLSKNVTGSQPSTAAIGGGLIPKETPKTHSDSIFSSIGASIFSSKSNDAEQDQEDNSDAHDTSNNVDYSIVSLPELDNIQSGEENEEALFVERAKLFRFHNSEWKDKGLGEMKVLKHRSTGKIRLLMRRDQILKICCNHYVVPAMKFKYLQDSKRMLCWFTNAEFSDEEIKSEKLAIKFKTDEIATKFKQTVEFAVEELSKTDTSNESNNSTQELERDTKQLGQTSFDIRGRLAPPKGSWSCNVCLVTNKESANECVACSTKNPNSAAVSATSTSFGEGGTTSTATSLSFGESGGFKLSTGLSFGTTPAATTAPTGGFKLPLLSTATTAPTGGLKLTFPTTAPSGGFPTGGFKLSSTTTTNVTALSSGPTVGFPLSSISTKPKPPDSGLSKFTPSKDVWSCDTCLLVNQKDSLKCVACESFKPMSTNKLLPSGKDATPFVGFKLPSNDRASFKTDASNVMQELEHNTEQLAQTSSNIRERLAPPKGNWSCDVCLITNKESANECVACSTKNPNSSAVTTSFGEGETFSTSSTATLLFGESGGFKLSTGLSFGTTPAATTAPTGGFKMPLLSTATTAPTGLFNTPLLSTATTAPTGLFNMPLSTATTAPTGLFNMPLSTATTAPTGLFNTPLLSTATTAPTGLFNMPLSTATTAPTGLFNMPLSTATTAPTGLFNMPLGTATTAPTGLFNTPLLSTATTAPTGLFNMPLSTATTAPTGLFNMPLSTATTAPTGVFQSGFAFSSFSFAATPQQDTEEAEDRESAQESDNSGSVTPDHHVSRSDPIDALSDGEEDSTDSVLFVAEEIPPPEKVELAKKYMLPITFYNYEKKALCPGCRGCTEDPPVLEQPGSPDPSPNLEASVDNPSETVLCEEGDKAVKNGAGVKQEDGPKETTIKAAFSFLSSDGKANSFSELASGGFQWSSGNSQGFSGAGRPVFGASSADRDGEVDPEAEVNITFKPLVTLPEVETKTGEEFDEALFSHRAKLYRFDSNVNQWKERGVGDIKITRNKTTNKTRIIMRRDLIKKLCCNHFINSVMDLTPNQGSDRSWVWYTPGDFSDGEARPEKLAVRFKYQETATEFKNVFDECKQLKVSPDPDLTTEKPEECEEGKSPVDPPTEVRSIVNERDIISDTSSNEESQDSVSEHDETDGDSITDDNSQPLGEDLRLKLAPPPGAWTCTGCLLSNTPSATHCVACSGAVREETAEVLSTPPLKLAPPPGAWTCIACLLSNTPSATHCVACGDAVREETAEVLSTPPLEAVKICSPDSSTNRNPLLRFPLVLSPVSSVPYVCPKPVPPLETTPLETENPLPITTATKKNNSHSQSEPILLEEPNTESQVDDNNQDYDIVFLYEDLPDLELIAKAKQLMLPPAFFLYEKKTPCSGCRGCRDESDLEDNNTHSESDASITQDPPEEATFAPAKQPPSPVEEPKESDLKDSSTHSESDASITQDPPEEATFAPAKQPPSPVEEPKESDLEDSSTHSESDASITQDPPEEATFAPAKQPPSPVEEPKESDLEDSSTHSESDASITQDPPEEATFAPAKQPPAKQPPSPVEEPKESNLEDSSTHSESDASITQDPPEEATFAPAKQPPSPVEEPKESNLEDSSTHSESDASITQDPPEEATFAPAKQPPSPVEEPKESDLEDSSTHSESDASITQDPPEEATFAPAKQPPSPVEEPKESNLEDSSTHSESDASITQDPPEEATFAPTKQPPSPVEEPKGFFSQTDRVSFSDLAPQTTSGFATATPGFQFQGAGKQLFAVQSADDGETNPEEEIDINFKPLVSLHKVAPTKSWDDEAGTLFTSRGKLFRFDDSINQWKERGVGDIKILQHAETGRCRILMRRDQILKICCNHNITAEMTLLPGNTDKSWVWFTQSDFTDEEPKKEKLAVRFKHVETAREFKEVFEQCVKRDTESDSA